jgi:hypothetical protein
LCPQIGIEADGLSSVMGDQPSVEAHRELPPRPRSHIDLRSMICARNARATRRPWSELANYWVMPTRESHNASIAENQR